MRCNFRSTTALAAALALLSPAALLAETPLPSGEAAAMDAASRENMPRRAAILDEELARGLGPDGLSCTGDAPRPCPDGEALVTPQGLAVHLSQDGGIVLAPRPQQRTAAQTDQRGDAPAASEAGAPAADQPAAERGEAGEARAGRADERAQARAERQAARAERQEANAASLTDADAAAQAASGEAVLAQAEPPAPRIQGQERAEGQAARAAREAAAAEAAPDADALAQSLARAEAEAEAPAGEPVALPEPEPAAPVAVEEDAAQPVASEAEAPSEEPAPEAEAAFKAAEAQPAPAPEEVAPTPLAERSAPVPEVNPTPEVIEEPAPLAERSEPIPVAEPQEAPAPVVAEPVTPRSQPIPEETPQAAPVVVEPQAADAMPDAGALAEALATAAGGNAPAAAPAETAAAAAAAAAAMGQPEAPTTVEVDEEAARSIDETLRQAAEARAPAAKAPQQQPARGNAGQTAADAAAAAAAGGNAPVADALSAPATISDNATAVVVTEGSARSASEDFATRLTEGLTQEQRSQFQRLQEQLAQQQQDGQPVVVGDGNEASKDDDDNTQRDLARVLLGGIGGYVLANVLANNGQIALSTPDRVVVEQPDGTQTIIKDDNALLLQPGARVTTEDFADGSSRTIVAREDGSRVVTIRDANLRVLRRTLIAADGTVTELIDDAAPVDPVVVADLPPPARPIDLSGPVTEDALRAALARETAVDRRFTLSQIRSIPEVRGLVAPVEIDAITFDTGSAAIRPDQAQQLATLGKVISDYVRANPGEVFLVEGHTDTVGGAAMNLALSDRRAESVALALAQYFHVPPENMVVQGYGEQHLKVSQEGDIRANRRASVRRITDLLARN